MRFVNGLFRFILLSAVAFSTGVMRGYDSTLFDQQAPVSAIAKYLSTCGETDPAAVLSPRTDPLRLLHLHPRRLPVVQSMACIKTPETGHVPSITASGVLPLAHAVSITPQTLLSLSCLLTV